MVDASDAGGEGLGPAVDCRQHPRNWDLRAIAALLDEVVNTSASDSPGPIPPFFRVLRAIPLTPNTRVECTVALLYSEVAVYGNVVCQHVHGEE